MSILETFYVLFKGDDSSLKSTATDAKKITDGLNTTFSDTAKAGDKVGASFVGMAKSLAGFITAAASVGAVVAAFKAATDYSIELNNVSRLLGVNITQLDAYGNTIQKYGGTAAGFQSSLKSLAQNFGTTPSAALQLLPQLADTFQRFGRFKSFQYGRMLGLDDPTILMLQRGRKEIEAQITRQKELGLVDKQNAEIAQKYNSALQDMSHAFRSLYTELGLTFLPVFARFADTITNGLIVLRKHIDVVKGGLIAVAAVTAILIAPFIAANAAVIALVTAVTGLIAVFALAYDDIKAFSEGHNSLIGDIIKKYGVFGASVHASFALVRREVELLLGPLLAVIDAFEKIGDYFKTGSKSFTAELKQGQQLLGAAGANYFNSQTSTSIFGGSTLAPSRSISTGDITINTQATDADGIATGFIRGLQDHFGQANSNFDDGVVA